LASFIKRYSVIIATLRMIYAITVSSDPKSALFNYRRSFYPSISSGLWSW